MAKTTIELLQEARERLSVKEHWCTRSRWQENESNCAIGSLQRAADPGSNWANWRTRWPYTDEQINPAIERLSQAAVMLEGFKDVPRVPGLTPNGLMRLQVVTLNDEKGWERVKEMFGLAIKLEQEAIDRQAKVLVESAELVKA